jgi:hypothetical protein
VGGPWELAAMDDFVFVAEWGMHRVKILKLDAKTGQLRAEGFFGAFGYADEPGRGTVGFFIIIYGSGVSREGRGVPPKKKRQRFRFGSSIFVVVKRCRVRTLG